MAFGSSSVIENFNGVGGTTPPNANWTNGLIGSGGLTIFSNTCGPSASGGNGYYNASTFGPDCEAFMAVTSKPANTATWQIAARIQSPGSASWDGYKVVLNPEAGTDLIELYRVDNNVSTQLGSGIGQEFTAGDSLGIECAGSSIKSYYKAAAGSWVQQDSQTDSTYSGSGNVGILTTGTTAARGNDLAAGNITTTITGDCAITLPSVTVAASGTETITGTSAITLNAVTTAASGAETMTGSAAAALPAVTVAATGDVVSVIMAGAVVLPAVTMAASGAVTMAGTAAVALPAVTTDASGTVINPVTGEAAIALPSVQVSAAGTETISGAAAVTFPAVTGSASGVETISGSAAVTVPAIAVSASGLVAQNVTGTVAAVLASVTLDVDGHSFAPLEHQLVATVLAPPSLRAGVSLSPPPSRRPVSL